MATYAKIILSGSTNGRPIAITNTAATGTIIHTSATATGNNNADEVYLWANNHATTSGPHRLTVEFGGTSGTDQMVYDIFPGEHIMVVPGVPLNAGLVVRAFATASTLFNVYGYVNRIAT